MTPALCMHSASKYTTHHNHYLCKDICHIWTHAFFKQNEEKKYWVCKHPQRVRGLRCQMPFPWNQIFPVKKQEKYRLKCSGSCPSRSPLSPIICDWLLPVFFLVGKKSGGPEPVSNIKN